jgi:hypothetical protein
MAHSHFRLTRAFDRSTSRAIGTRSNRFRRLGLTRNAYNQAVVLTSFSLRLGRAGSIAAGVGLLCVLAGLTTVCAFGQ